MSSQITTKDVVERVSSLKKKPSLETMLEGLKEQERLEKVLVVLIDTSSSMLGQMETSSKIEVAWRVFNQELMPNMAGWSYGILSFNDYINWLVWPGSNAKTLDSVPPTCGSTHMGEALKTAWIWVKGNATSARFILLTDGQANYMPKEIILSLARENTNIPIDTVGIGQGTGEYDPEFLKQLSAITGGMFSAADSVKLLATTIKKLSPKERPLLGTVNKEK